MRKYWHSERIKWRVISAGEEDGGTGHGPHDVFPPGHRVYAESMGENPIHLDFYQTGSFIGMLPPERIRTVT